MAAFQSNRVANYLSLRSHFKQSNPAALLPHSKTIRNRLKKTKPTLTLQIVNIEEADPIPNQADRTISDETVGVHSKTAFMYFSVTILDP